MKVRFTPAAFEDAAEISQTREARVAARLEAAVFSTTDRLGERPEFGVATDDEEARRWPMPQIVLLSSIALTGATTGMKSCA